MQWVTTAIPATVAVFQTSFTAIKGAIDLATAAFNAFLQVIRDAATTTTAALATLRDSIKSAWSALDFSDLGRAIVDGLVNGIKAQASLAVEAAKGMARQVADGAKSILGIHSPSRVFHEIGDNVGQGFIAGILGRVGEAGKAIAKLVSPTGSNGSSLGFGASFASNFAPRAIDLNQQTGQPLVKSMVAGADQVKGAWGLAMKESTDAIGDFVKTGQLDFQNLLDSILSAIATSALKGAIEGLFKGIGSSVSGGTFGTSGGWGDILGAVVKGFTSFEGGGFTGSGSRTGGIDGRGGMLAMVHPNETVIDHEKVRRSSTARRASGRPIVNVSTPITLMPGVSRDELAKILPVLKRDILQTIPDLIALGGRRASAFGR